MQVATWLLWPVAVLALAVLFSGAFCALFLRLARALSRTRFAQRRAKSSCQDCRRTPPQEGFTAPRRVAFFHPFANDGGGGERVLWAAVDAVLSRNYPCESCGKGGGAGSDSSSTGRRVSVVIYAGFGPELSEDVDPEKRGERILQQAKQRFAIDLLDYAENEQISFVFLHHRWLVEPQTWPHFTLLGQSAGSSLLALEALWAPFRDAAIYRDWSRLVFPEVFLDTMGYAFTYPVFSWLAGAAVGCYTHYPTISTDMFAVVRERTAAFNNAAASSKLKSKVKLVYYRMFAVLYGFMGRRSQVTLVNSTWTRNHIAEIWGIKPKIVFPPCNTLRYTADIPLTCAETRSEAGRDATILSLGQFRPEKNNELQLRSFARFLRREKENPGAAAASSGRAKETPRLVLIGSCRNDGDYARVARLKKLAFEELGLTDGADVEFCVNASYAELQKQLRRAMVGVHTMWNEHFGIGVVEFMAAGVVAVAHDSGGPKSDIVVPALIPDGGSGRQPATTELRSAVGFLASTEEGYADAFQAIVYDMGHGERTALQQRARDHVSVQFSDETFARLFVETCSPLWGWRVKAA